MVFQRSIVNWSLGVDVSSVYVHSVICDTYVGQWYCIELLLVGMWGLDVFSVYVHCVICITYLV